eukprot:TRINITY_DN48600_c0_g1_i1.p1 TRINITY_DN48600_c0_g1~~TRINITY_DN48600_c0_g1_i1.p1  ORF type:complete len:262 (+),score=48.06 TRINITY_DN48600_c0_g1_i1:94-879(+)
MSTTTGDYFQSMSDEAMERMFEAQRRSIQEAKEAAELEKKNPHAVGRYVVIDGLQKRPELNGKLGEVVEKANAEGRAAVRVHGQPGRPMLVKLPNASPIPDEETVRAVRLGCAGEGAKMKLLDVRLPKRLLSDADERCPVPTGAGVPLRVMKAAPFKELKDRADYDNQWATFMMIDEQSGFAPPCYQSHVGPVYIYRSNGPLSVDDVLFLYDWISNLLERWSDGTVKPSHLTSKALQACKQRYLDNERLNPDYHQSTDINI